METWKNILLSALLIALITAIDWLLLSQIIASILQIFGKSRGVGFFITLRYTLLCLTAITGLCLTLAIFRGDKAALIVALIGHVAVMVFFWPGADAKKFLAVITSSYILFFLMLKLQTKARAFLRLDY